MLYAHECSSVSDNPSPVGLYAAIAQAIGFYTCIVYHVAARLSSEKAVRHAYNFLKKASRHA